MASVAAASVGMTSSLDVMLRSLEDIDKMERGIQEAIDSKPGSHWGGLVTDHRVAKAIERIQEKSKRVLSMLEDSDGLRGEEVAAMRAAGEDASDGDASDMLAVFYARVAEAKEYYATHPDAADVPDEPEPALRGMDPGAAFSGAEVLGLVLDVAPLAEAWAHVPGAGKASAISFCDGLQRFREALAEPLGAGRFASAPYRSFLRLTAGYLCSFFRRTHPLASAEALLEGPLRQRLEAAAGGDGIDLESVGDVAELEAMGPDVVKAELVRRGLKCGGTPAARAKRLFSVRGLEPDAVPRKLRARSAGTAASGSSGGGGKARPPDAPAPSSASSTSDAPAADASSVPFETKFPPGGMRAAWLEDVVATMADTLRTAVQATRQRVERRETLTAEERERDAEEELTQARGGDGADGDDDGDESDDDPIASGKARLKRNVVLGPDGEPISHWLYRLHGLDKSYHCEICGQTLWGPRNFERHFNAPEHASAMKALGIPNSRHFFGVVTIEDARKLWARLETTIRADKAASAEQFEDSAGNILDKRTYDDLSRQGML